MDEKMVGKFNWQSYILTPVSILLARSGYKVYTHILGEKLPRLSTLIKGNVKKVTGWCDTSCGDPKYRERCLEKETSGFEIDALIFRNEKGCVIEHASDIDRLCGDMVKVYKLINSQKGLSSALFLTWIDPDSEKHAECVEVTTSLGRMLFNDLIGKENWSKIYIIYELKDGVYLSLGEEIGGVIHRRHHSIEVRGVEKEIFKD